MVQVVTAAFHKAWTKSHSPRTRSASVVMVAAYGLTALPFAVSVLGVEGRSEATRRTTSCAPRLTLTLMEGALPSRRLAKPGGLHAMTWERTKRCRAANLMALPMIAEFVLCRN